jgi:hypothetical protein
VPSPLVHELVRNQMRRVSRTFITFLEEGAGGEEENGEEESGEDEGIVMDLD